MRRFMQVSFMMIAVLLFYCTNSAAAAINDCAAGYWQTIDEKTNKPSSIIHIFKKKDEYVGQIYKTYVEGKQKADDICTSCKGEQKNKPMLGLTIIHGMQQIEPGQYKHGHVLDPRYGKLYHAEMKLADGGKELKLRGYVGMPLFGKTTTWYRVNKNGQRY